MLEVILMSEVKERGNWNSRFTFILAAIGSAVGLGNAWRFPGLCAKYGGGAFLLVYLVMMLIMGIPLLMMEIAIGRKAHRGAPNAMKSMNKKFEFIGWCGTTNAFFIVTYYAVVFAWVILMTICCFKFGQITNTADAASKASSIWANYKYGNPYRYLILQSIFLILGFIVMIIIYSKKLFSFRNPDGYAGRAFDSRICLLGGIGLLRGDDRMRGIFKHRSHIRYIGCIEMAQVKALQGIAMPEQTPHIRHFGCVKTA